MNFEHLNSITIGNYKIFAAGFVTNTNKFFAAGMSLLNNASGEHMAETWLKIFERFGTRTLFKIRAVMSDRMVETNNKNNYFSIKLVLVFFCPIF